MIYRWLKVNAENNAICSVGFEPLLERAVLFFPVLGNMDCAGTMPAGRPDFSKST